MNTGKLSSIALAVMLSNTAFAAHDHKAPADAALINESRILYWLEKRGELPPMASEQTKQEALKAYLTRKSFETPKLEGEFGQKVMNAEHMPRIAIADRETQSKLQKQFAFSSQKSASSMVNNTVKVLAITVDFPDLPHNANRLTELDTQMYYPSYPTSHYEALLFSESGYAGPSGQTIESAYQFYQEESGQSLNFTGNVVGWVTAENNAETYGGNDGDSGNDKNVPALVLEAVTKAVADHNIDLSEYDQTDFFDIDGDGNYFEPDGIIDHVMLFHSSVGEEAGGGVLGDDAIWSHRFFVFGDDNQPVAVPGSDIKLYGYTINPIDAATGVVVHEFGHDLGVPDEYDTANGQFSSPVGNWSVMSSGSWVGSPAGTSPVSFSPYARDFFQTKYGGNWINQEVIDYANLGEQVSNLVAATNHEAGTNQIKVELPLIPVPFAQPYSGDYQFYSNDGDMKSNSVSFDVTLPADAATLSMKAHWDIEEDWDYLYVRANGEPLAGNHTKASNQHHANVTNFITGKSADIAGSEGDLGWVDLTFDLAAYAGTDVTLTINYITDQSVGGYGFVADDLVVATDSETVFSHGAEETTGFTLDGFSRIGATRDGAPHHYYIQLRDNTDTDALLPSVNNHKGVLLWYNDTGIANNRVNAHPGRVFTGVVDADPTPIKSASGILYNTSTQINDAAFRLEDHPATERDTNTTAVATFDDRNDYSMPAQPESGIALPFVGMKMTVDSISSDYGTASLTLTNSGMERIVAQRNGMTVNFALYAEDVTDENSIVWQLGDGSQETGRSVSYSYTTAGDYDVTVSYDATSGNKTLEQSVAVGAPVTGSIAANVQGSNVTVSADLSGGVGALTYRWSFGDDSEIVTSQGASHTYETRDQFEVTLVVTDEINQRYTFTQNVDVVESLNVQIGRTIEDLNVEFVSTVTGGTNDYSYAWDFGDGNTSTESDPSHSYASEGTYTVELTVTDTQGASSTDTLEVSVSAPATSNPGTPTTPTTPTTPPTSSSSGGGSMAWFLVALFAGLSRRLTLRK